MAKEPINPIAEGLFTIPQTPDEKPRLIGSRCRRCGLVFFPKEVVCCGCFEEDMEQALLSNKGKLYSFTVVRQRPMAYIGPMPYLIGLVSLPEGAMVMSLLTPDDPGAFSCDADVEMVLERIDPGQDTVTYKFKPV